MAPNCLEFKREEVLQAVIIGETFDNQFDPITRAVPKVLMPLVNTPILDYTLEWFHRCGMQDVILYCRATPFSDEIKEHCKSLVARRQWTTMTVRVIASDSIRSMGDAMRDLYAKSLVTGDFLLINGATLSNINIRQMVKLHKLNRERDPKTAMTILLLPTETDDNAARQGHDDDNLKSPTDQQFSTRRVSTITNALGKVLWYQRHRRGTGISFPTYVMNDNNEVFVTAQSPDPSMTICSIDVPGLFADNFDCMTRDGLVKGLVEPDDLNCCSVYQHVVRDGFTINIATWGDYERASLSMIQRRLSPLRPEVSLTSGRHRYQYIAYDCYYRTPSCNLAGGTGGRQGHFLDERNTRQQLARMAYQVVFGEGIEVSDTASIRSCVFGNHCSVGDNTVLDRAFVGDNCIIEAGCKVTQSYIGHNVHLLPNTVLEKGCVISAGVTLGPNKTLSAASLVATKDLWDTLDELEVDQDPEQVSTNGFLFPRDASCFIDDTSGSDEDSDDEFSTVARAGPSAAPSGVAAGYTMSADGQMLPIWGLTVNDLVLDEEADGDEDDGEDCVDGPMVEELDEDEQRELGFLHEVMDSLMMGLRENMDVAKVALEINASRYAYNISLETMQQIVFTGVLRCDFEESSGLEAGSSLTNKLPWPAWPSIKKGLYRYKDVLQKYLKTDNDFLNTIERVVCSDSGVLACAVKLLYELTQELELVDDSAVLLWFRKGGIKGSQPSEGFQQFKEKVADFLTWLENAEEESSEEEESDSEED